MSLLDNPFGMRPRGSTNSIEMLTFSFFMICVFMAYDMYIMKPQLAAQKAVKDKEVMAVSENRPLPRAEALAKEQSPRVTFENAELRASLDLKGARLDDLVLKKYFETVENKENVALLSPSTSDNPQLVQFGWLSDGKSIVPDNDTLWRVREQSATRAVIEWTSPQNVRFEQTIALDDTSLFTVTSTVENKSGAPVTLYPFGRVTREGLPVLQNAGILHEGPIAYIDGKLHEEKFSELDKDRTIAMEGGNGWIGITEKYWLAALLYPKSTGISDFRFTTDKGTYDRPLYQADARGAPMTVATGQSASTTAHSFVGAKVVKTLDAYSKKLDLPHFDLAVDFGRFYFLTRPFFAILDFWGHLVGSFAIGLLLTALTIRTFTFPLANTTYRSFAKLRKLAPQMSEMKEKFGHDREKMQMELLKFYQKEKVNPAAGCVPMLLQIPIFFALYKVVFVTIEMRHAPFFGWIKDMSAADPTSIFNLFGLIPWMPPQFLMIGAWPLIYCATMMLLQRLQPPPADPTQRAMMTWMPVVFTFMLAHFPAGLVIYWSWSTVLSIIQQTIIMKSMGVDVHLFHSSKHKKSDVEIFDRKDDPLIQVVEAIDVTDDQPREPKEPKAITPPKRGKR